MNTEREIEKTYSIAEFVAELRRLADALESGDRFTIRSYDEDVVVPDDAGASVAFEVEDGRAELEFQLTWAVEEAEQEADDADDASEEAEAVA